MIWTWRLVGLACLGLGGIGLLVPVMPTTIFWILAALCLARSDPKIRDWIYARPGVGSQVELFVEQGRMTRASKRAALIGMALASALLIWLMHARPVVLACSLGFVLVGAIFVVTRKGAAS